MGIPIKSERQIKEMIEACRITARTHEEVEKYIRVGVTTYELDKIAEDYIKSRGAVPSFKGYHGYPKTICASVNEEVVHGIPNKRKLVCGDILGLDIGAYYKGYHGDCARTFPIGKVSEEAMRLINVTKQSFFEGIKYAKVGNRLFEISGAIDDYIKANGFSVVRDFVGHGIGRDLHEEPQIPHYRMPNKGIRLGKGMTLAIEPMINEGVSEVEVLDDGWTAVTLDRMLSAHYENVVAITDGEPFIMTVL